VPLSVTQGRGGPGRPGARAQPRLGVVFPAHADVATLPAFAQRIEALGYGELWVVEDCFLSSGIAMSATALASTSTLRVGLGLMPAPMRNAALAAMEIGTLARLHPGRFAAAFGHGVRAWMEQIGALPAQRLSALAEVTSAVRSLLAGELVTCRGSHVNLAGVALEPAPASAPTILIGSTGPRGVALAGSLADGLLLPEGCGPAFIADAVRLAAQAAPEGRRPLTVVYAWLRIEDDDDQARAALRPVLEEWIARGLYPGAMAAAGIVSPLAPGPVAAELAAQLSVAGDPRVCAALAAGMLDAGADSLVLVAVGDDHEAQYARFARDVFPLLDEHGHLPGGRAADR
jgi:alkanesulfonate monooxygenase SsuD/methylene tetrahydromethanopterin reductase-like flavin-dependent oxidoreductase (luciferase family)